MNYSDFLAHSASTAALPLTAYAAPVVDVPGLVERHLNGGEALFLDFKASWCSTCAAQQRVIGALTSKTPDCVARITFVDVDRDAYGPSDLTKGMNISRRSNPVVLKGDQDLERLRAQTSTSQIKALMDTESGTATA